MPDNVALRNIYIGRSHRDLLVDSKSLPSEESTGLFMNFAFLPDLLALTILIVILLLLRRRPPQEQAALWLLGLLFTLIESLAHIFYAPNGLPSTILHVIVIDCYLFAGLVFVWA